MRNGGKYSVAVRKPDGEIESEVWDYHSVIPWKVLLKIPFIRGIFNFVDSLVLGMKTLMYSASFFEEEEEGELLTKEEAQKREKKEKIIMNITVVISLLAAAALFMILPYVLSGLLKRVTSSRVAVTVFEGVIRVAIFLIYIFLISRNKRYKKNLYVSQGQNISVLTVSNTVRTECGKCEEKFKTAQTMRNKFSLFCDDRKCDILLFYYGAVTGDAHCYQVGASSPYCRCFL